jgi:hypothetical protein
LLKYPLYEWQPFDATQLVISIPLAKTFLVIVWIHANKNESFMPSFEQERLIQSIMKLTKKLLHIQSRSGKKNALGMIWRSFFLAMFLGLHIHLGQVAKANWLPHWDHEKNLKNPFKLLINILNIYKISLA